MVSRRWAGLSAVLAAMLMNLLDANVVIVAAPTIRADDGIGEAVGEHGPVATVDTHRVLDDLLADLGAVFEPADAGFEIGRPGRPPRSRGLLDQPLTR